ncbi:hypothetical protein BOTBODRAFT_152072 [Botryobasidium botryosum FD-172 SS1]|uniref:Squalene synthase n=1 Tax=Botryobasidium botryosum (strain FD-172 SS1) TaxID=930990 RepID=A0A067NB89_BOTB1|nr:hypothetical protein BOTBODRAFT_152072 [Botryobasidium botryosum FD-172 SS1]
MGALEYLKLAVTRPNDLRALIQFWIWHETKRDITSMKEHPTSGWDRASMRRCWEFLDMTSRSFSAVIKELDGDLARVICLFYLVLRGLDTIEDDPSIPDDIKQPMLRSFHKRLSEKGWTFNGNRQAEKDRQLLVEFNVVIDEMARLDPLCTETITRVCRQMAVGMADFAHRAATTDVIYVETIEEYDLYCHYVAGLVGEGLSALFAATEKESPYVAEQLVLSNSMGLLLQKTNILRDYREDVDLTRYFWPREIWGAYGFKELAELKDPKNRERAMWALSGMTLDALRHATDALDYLTLLRNQSVFNFCAIPAVMAIATLALCFMNGNVFERNVKITKAQAVKLIMDSTNPRDVAYTFRFFARQLHAKAVPDDPNFLKLSIACGKIEQWCEHHYPSFVTATVSGGTTATSYSVSGDARLRIVERERTIATARQRGEKVIQTAPGAPLQSAVTQEGLPWELIGFFAVAFTIVIGLSVAVVWGVLRFYGDE